MPESAKDLKGKAKEKVGDATDDPKTKREGQVEQAGEKIKSGIDRASRRRRICSESSVSRARPGESAAILRPRGNCTPSPGAT